MNTEWAPAIATGVITLVGWIFTYGRYTQTQTQHSLRLDDHDDLIQNHAEHLSRVDLALVRLEEYNRGFADATRLGMK